ncbi:hypothetical protein Tco_0228080 [Tanacetum coccineum]
MYPLIRKKFRWGTIFPIGLKRYKDPKGEPIEKDPLMELKGIGSVHDTFHVLNLKKCLADANLHVPLGEIKVDKTLRFVDEPVEIMDREIRKLKRRKIALMKVRQNSKCGPNLKLHSEYSGEFHSPIFTLFSWDGNDAKGNVPTHYCVVPIGGYSYLITVWFQLEASQDARLSKFEADFKQQQSEMINKIDTVLKAITDRIAGTLPSDMIKNPKLGISNFTGRIKEMHVFVGNFTYVVDFMIVEDISSIIDPRLSQVILERPFVKISNMTHDPPEGFVIFVRGVDEVAYKMPHKIEQYDSLSDLEKEHTKSVYLRNEEDKRRGVEYVMSKILGFYKECLELGPEYLTGVENEGEVM